MGAMSWFSLPHLERAAHIRRSYGTVESPSALELSCNAIMCAVFIVPSYFLFSSRNQALVEDGHSLFLPMLAVDDAIPLVPEFIWLYCLYYPAFFVVLLATTADRRVMYEGVVGYVVTALLALVCFGLLPSRMDQPSLEGCATTACALLSRMYAADGGDHIFPSLHVAYPVCAWLLMRRTLSPWIARPFLVLVLGIAASTVFLKRHALVDVPAGVLTGFLAWYVGRCMGWRLLRLVNRARWWFVPSV